MLIDDFNFSQIKRRTFRHNITKVVQASYAVIGSYMIWKLIGVFLNNDFPIVCVLSESMEPGFKRGDILFIKPQDYKVGDVSVFQIYEGSIPIVHRVIKKIGDRLLTKGDNNHLDDVGLYKPGKRMLEVHEMRAGVFGYIPFFGMITIWISQIPGLKLIFMLYTAFTVFSTA
jgi:signal peptidase I